MSHEEEMLAESENVSVHQCTCGKVHLQIGAVCLTMEAVDLAEVGTVIMRALEASRGLRPQPEATIN
jgi:hypothetical protein